MKWKKRLIYVYKASTLLYLIINYSVTGTLIFNSANTPPPIVHANRREPFPFRKFSPLLRAHLTKSCIAHRNVNSSLHVNKNIKSSSPPALFEQVT